MISLTSLFLFAIEVTRKSRINMLWIYDTVDLVLKREPDREVFLQLVRTMLIRDLMVFGV